MNQLPRNSKKGCYCFQKDLEQTFSEMTNFILGNWYLLVKKKKNMKKKKKSAQNSNHKSVHLFAMVHRMKLAHPYLWQNVCR